MSSSLETAKAGAEDTHYSEKHQGGKTQGGTSSPSKFPSGTTGDAQEPGSFGSENATTRSQCTLHL